MLMKDLKELLKLYKENLHNASHNSWNKIPGDVFMADKFFDKIEDEIHNGIGIIDEWLDEIEDEIQFQKENLEA